MMEKTKQVKVKNSIKIIDYKYGGDLQLSKFVNAIMLSGKKSIALSIVYGALENLKSDGSETVLEVFHQALNNVKPALEVKSKRVGGATYQVPIEVSQARQASLAMRWIINAAKKRPGKSMVQKLSAELMDAYKSTGAAYKKKEETHRMADANKAFSHYR